MRTANKKGLLQFFLTIMLVMFVGNMTLSAQTGKVTVNQSPGYELVPFGSENGRATCVLQGTNTLFSIATPNKLVSREAKGSERVFYSDMNFSQDIFAVAGDYNNKSVAISFDGYVYVIDRVTGHITVPFKAVTSFKLPATVFGSMTTIDNDPTKVYICGEFDSIIGKSNTPKFMMCFDLVTGDISPVITEQPYSVNGFVKFKNKLILSMGWNKNWAHSPSRLVAWDISAGTFSNIEQGTFKGGGKLITNGTTLLATGYKQSFINCLFQYDEPTNTLVTLFTGVNQVCVYKGEFYLGTKEVITNSSNEEITANYFIKYNAEYGEISTFNGLILDGMNVEFEQMFAGKDYLLFGGSPAYRLQPIASGISGHSNASALNVPNPMPCKYSLLVPTDYIGSALTITGLNGQVLFKGRLQDVAVDLDLQPGMYIMEIRNEKTYEYRKIIVR